MSIRQLIPGDQSKLEHFLRDYVETSMFIMSNVRASGLLYRDQHFHGDYYGFFNDDNNIQGVLVHYWNGNIMMQAKSVSILDRLIVYFRSHVSRPIAGILGERALVEQVINGLDLAIQRYAINQTEDLYSLELNALIQPATINASNYQFVASANLPTSILFDWIKRYDIEALGATDNADLNDNVKSYIETINANTNHWVLLVDNTPVCLSGFNARLDDIVQVGPVWTPPQYRNKGYARTLLAWTLIREHKHGVNRSILFTKDSAAATAYTSIGFKKIGKFKLALLKD